MKKVVILSGGTATAWHVASVLRKYYSDRMSLTVCDINPPELVCTSVLADQTLKVPPIRQADYYERMLQTLCDENADILVPLIDDDIRLFPGDSPDLSKIGVRSVAPGLDVCLALSDKRNLANALSGIGVRSPKAVDPAEVKPDETYFVKDAVGCGSKGSRRATGRELCGSLPQAGQVIEEICSAPEITVDTVAVDGKVYTVCRERLEMKLGVSTKCRVYYDPEIQQIMERISANIRLPSVCCVQFMKDTGGNWSLIDFNLRSGGGTAISAAVGFEAVRYAAANWLGAPCEEAWLKKPEKERIVVRTYQELVTV